MAADTAHGGLQLALRSRSMFEALDLGTRMAWREWPGLLRVYAPVALFVAIIALASGLLSSWAPWIVVWFCKPWLDRVLLHFYARRAFAQPCTLADVLTGPVLFSPRLWPQLLAARLSPWRAMVQPVMQLEGLRGPALAARKKVLLGGCRGAAAMSQLAWAHLEAWLACALAIAYFWADPFSPMSQLIPWISSEEGSAPVVLAICQVLAALVLEPLSLAGGFMMYLNRRVTLESWDIEQEVRDAFAA